MPRFPNGIRGLEDLIAGVTPTLIDWTSDPTDAADITDGDISTFCTTGNKVSSGGYQYAYFEWDLGAFYNVLCGGGGHATVSAGVPAIYLYFWNGASWLISNGHVCASSTIKEFTVYSANCSKVRLGITSTVAATITPNIRNFHLWRL